MDIQEQFNTMVNHLRNRKVRSLSGYSCAYRGANGTKCAVGILIPDDLYEEEMEGQGAATLIPDYPELGIDLTLAEDMQSVHDNFPGGCWENEFRRVAENFNLTIPEKV